MTIRTILIRTGTAALFGTSLLAASALAGPTYTFATSEGVQPSNVGVITLTQVNSTTVDVLVDLNDTTLPLPQYGFINTGNDNTHTPFAFTLAGTESGASATFIQPAGGAFTFGLFTLDLAGGPATPYGTFGVAIADSAGNGSGNAYYGDLEFQLIRTSGLSTDDFITNAAIDPGSSGPAYFAADLTNGASNTGASVSVQPQMQPSANKNGWIAESGLSPYEASGKKGVVLLVRGDPLRRARKHRHDARGHRLIEALRVDRGIV